MKLLFITASSREIKKVRKSRFLNFQQVTMPYLAALTPSDWEIDHVDEEVEEINYNNNYDLVAITFHTPSAGHAYEISAKFRAKNTVVVLGGPHVTLLPHEAQENADVIFIGEAEETWPKFLKDFENNCYIPVYEQMKPSCLNNLPFPRKDLFHRRDFTSGVMCNTRGCNNRCEFCVIHIMYKNNFRRRPVDEAAAEFGSFRGKRIIFWDDNIVADIDYAKQLFKAIAVHKKWWSSQASIHAGDDNELLELAAKSGCKQLFLGLESVSQDSLNISKKNFNKVENYYKIIRRIQSYGIAVQAGIVFGFD